MSKKAKKRKQPEARELANIIQLVTLNYFGAIGSAIDEQDGRVYWDRAYDAICQTLALNDHP